MENDSRKYVRQRAQEMAIETGKMAYLVTCGKDKENAEKDLHAIVYKDYVTIENVTGVLSK